MSGLYNAVAVANIHGILKSFSIKNICTFAVVPSDVREQRAA
jgi:hypothetical protein